MLSRALVGAAAFVILILLGLAMGAPWWALPAVVLGVIAMYGAIFGIGYAISGVNLFK